MKTDTYTKTILTIIAIVLTLNLLKSAITPANAENKRFMSVPVNADGTISVRIKQSPKDVLDVNIETTAIGAFRYGGPLEVKGQN